MNNRFRSRVSGGVIFILLLAIGWFGAVRFNHYLGGFLGHIDSTTGALLNFVYVFICLESILFRFYHSNQQKILVVILFGAAFSILMLIDYWAQLNPHANQ